MSKDIEHRPLGPVQYERALETSGQSEAYFESPSTSIETEICAATLRHLATGTSPSLPDNQDDNRDTLMTLTLEERKHYEEFEKRQKNLEKALSMILSASSVGPDEMNIQTLGWDYNLGDDGDWDGCHFLPGHVGRTFRTLQEIVVYEQLELNHTISAEEIFGPWWREPHRRHYESGYEMSSTRFCTVGTVPPKSVAYNKGGTVWGAPFAGVCVPSSCTARSLYELFILEQDGFPEELLELATTSSGFIKEMEFHRPVPTPASKRYNYMSSLIRSISPAKQFQTGILCEGETGSAVLDQGYRDWGYYATMGLITILFFFMLLGTVSASFSTSPTAKNEKVENEVSTEKSDDSEDAENILSKPEEMYSSPHKETTLRTANTDNYGSTAEQNIDTTFLTNLGNKDRTNVNSPSVDSDYVVGSLANSEHSPKMDQKNLEVCNTIFEHFVIFMQGINSKFGYFNAGQSFYEITRMKMEDPNRDLLKQEVLNRYGEMAVDTYSSSPGLFPIYNRIGGDTDSDTTLSNHTISLSSSKCLTGMRSISMLWIILGHTVITQSEIGFENPPAFFPPLGVWNSRFGVFSGSARYAVDTFFFISGYLIMSGLLKKLDPFVDVVENSDNEDEAASKDERFQDGVKYWEQKLICWGIVNPYHAVLGDYAHRLSSGQPKNHVHPSSGTVKPKGLTWVFPLLLHRILRILPTYGCVLLLWWKVAITLGDGPLWPRWATFVERCDSLAWTNMLFINNLYPLVQPFGEMSECFPYAWYLGVDFQLCAVLTPIFVSLYMRKGFRMITIKLECLFLSTVIAASMLCTYKFHWSANLTDGADSGSFDRFFYINPFFRSSPYVIGFITAQIWHEKSRLLPNLGLTRKVSIILSILSVLLMMWLPLYGGGRGSHSDAKRPCLYWESPVAGHSQCGSGMSHLELIFYNSLMRPAWGLGLAILSLLSFNGQLNFLLSSSVLTWSGWDPIGKLSFSMYLVHPIVGHVWAYGRTQKFRYSLVELLISFAGNVVITFIVSLAISVLVEWPISKITRDFEKKLWSSFGKASNSNTTTTKGQEEESISLLSINKTDDTK